MIVYDWAIQQRHEEEQTHGSSQKSTATDSIMVRMDPELLDILDRLQRMTGSRTRSELMRNMVRYTAATASEIEEGGKPLVRDKKGVIRNSQPSTYFFAPLLREQRDKHTSD